MKTLEVKERGVVYIPLIVINKIRYICKKIDDVEWSGRVFYNVVEGSVKDIDKFKIELVDIYLEDKGTASYTKYETNEDIMDLFDKHPHLEDCRFGMIHSHSNNRVFFSSTDIDELKENHNKFEMYLSVVVNNVGDVTAKIAIPSIRQIKTRGEKTVHMFFKNEKKAFSKSVISLDNLKEEDVMVLIDMNIEFEKDEVEDDEFFTKRVDSVINKKEANKKRTYFDDTVYDDMIYGENCYQEGNSYGYLSAHTMTDNDVVVKPYDCIALVKRIMTGKEYTKTEYKTIEEISKDLFKQYPEESVKKRFSNELNKFDILVRDTLNRNFVSEHVLKQVLSDCIEYLETNIEHKRGVPACTILLNLMKNKEKLLLL